MLIIENKIYTNDLRSNFIKNVGIKILALKSLTISEAFFFRQDTAVLSNLMFVSTAVNEFDIKKPYIKCKAFFTFFTNITERC